MDRSNKFRLVFVCAVLVCVVAASGCESFRKKFIRKKKSQPQEEMVIAPRDYSKEQLPSDQAYQKYYQYWRAWHQELISYLHQGSNQKKIASCFEQTLLNLDRMKKLLANEEKKTNLDECIAQLKALQEESGDEKFKIASMDNLQIASDRLFRQIQRDFAFKKIKGDLQW